MRFARRDPGIGYLDNWLWIPKTHMSQLQVTNTFSYVSPKMEVIDAWVGEPHHFRVPRSYVSSAALGSMPFPIYDARFKNFPTVDIRSNVTLDSKEPSKTYQRDGSAALLAAYDGILCLRCGAGKTVVALHTAAQLKVPILVLVTNKGLARQWMDEITQFLNIPTEEIGRIGGDGSPFDWERPITVGMVQTITSRVAAGTLPPEMTRHFGVVICDEAHLMGAPYFNTAVPPFHGRRWGLSATPTRDDGFDSLLRYTVGGVVYSYLIPDLKPTVFFRRLPTRPDFNKRDVVDRTHDVSKNLHFGMLYSYFATDCPDRTDQIVKEVQGAVADGRQVLVLTHSRAMCELLGSMIPGAGVCHGGVKEDDRIRHIRECNPVIAIMQLGKEALNKPSLDTLFVCEPFTKKGALQQTMGRVLRSFSGKKSPIVVFFEDVYIRPLLLMCNKLRQSLVRWPSFKGGSIPFKIIKAKE
jgi:superfamily II DNA or RNA helicase